jgi:hypothetical protein
MAADGIATLPGRCSFSSGEGKEEEIICFETHSAKFGNFCSGVDLEKKQMPFGDSSAEPHHSSGCPLRMGNPAPDVAKIRCGSRHLKAK